MRFGYFYCWGLVFSVACTHSPGFRQRDYITSDVLSGKARYEGPGEPPREQRLRRSGTVGDMSLDITPLSEPMLMHLAETEGSKRSLPPHEIEKDKKDRLKTFGGDKTCFMVTSSGDTEDSADLQHLAIYYDHAGKLERLVPMMPSATPRREQHVGSTFDPRDSFRLDKRGFHPPSKSRNSSYSTYASNTFFCTDFKMDLSKGVTLLVQARDPQGIPAEDFVWSVDPKDEAVFRFNKGEPALKVRDDWNNQRRAHIDAKLSTIDN